MICKMLLLCSNVSSRSVNTFNESSGDQEKTSKSGSGSVASDSDKPKNKSNAGLNSHQVS